MTKNPPHVNITRDDAAQTFDVVVTFDDVELHRFMIRDDMPLDVQSDMLIDARFEMFGDNPGSCVYHLIERLRTMRADVGVTSG